MAANGWGWVRRIPKRPGGGFIEACAAHVQDPPGDGWIKADDALVDLLFEMESRVFKAEAALAKAKRDAHASCDGIEIALRGLRSETTAGGAAGDDRG